VRHVKQHRRYMQYFSLKPLRERGSVRCLGIDLRLGVILDGYAEECEGVDSTGSWWESGAGCYKHSNVSVAFIKSGTV
jgi:hypothetical protein